MDCHCEDVHCTSNVLTKQSLTSVSGAASSFGHKPSFLARTGFLWWPSTLARQRAECGDKSARKTRAKDNAGKNFTAVVPYALLEAGEFGAVNLIKLTHKLVQELALLTDLHTDTHCVVDDDGGKPDRHGKRTGIHALVVSNGGYERRDERAVRTRHVPRCKEVVPVNPVPETEAQELDALCGNDDNHRDDKHGVGCK